MKPKERDTNCDKTVYRAEEIDNEVLAHTKQFLTSLNKEKLLADHGAVLKAELKDASEQVRKIAKEAAQKEKELAKLRDEVIKVVMGESKFDESLLSNLIRQRESELAELAAKAEAAEKVVADMEAQIKLRKKVREDYGDWEARFDTLSVPERRAMLIEVIDRILVYGDRIHVKYKVKVDIFENADIGTQQSEGGNGETPSDLSFYPKQLVNSVVTATRFCRKPIKGTF
jgi:chromosome segregation ATPase